MRTKSNGERSRTQAAKRQKNKRNKIIIFFTRYFEKTWAGRLASFKLRSGNLDLFDLRVSPFPFLGLSVVADSAARFFCLFRYVEKDGWPTCGCSAQGGHSGKEKTEMMDRLLVAHHPITTSLPKSFFFRRRFCGECRRTSVTHLF